MKKYFGFLFIISLLFIFIGLISGKISGESFSYISIPGSLFAILQILFVVLIIMIGVAIMIPALVIDLLLLIFTGMNLPLIHSICDILWEEVTMGWFWAHTEGSSIFFASLILAILSFGMYRRKRR